MKKLLSVFLSACLALQGLPLGAWALEVFESVETAEEIPSVTREEVEASLSEAVFTDKEWTGQDETSQIFAINREQARVDSIPYASLETAITGAVDYNKSLSPYYQKLSALKAQNSAPDLACILQESFPQAIMQDYFQPLSVGKLDLSDSIYDKNTMEQFKWNNKYYGAMIKSSTMVTFNVCFFNKNIFKKANVTNPYDLWQKGQWNWDTLVSTSQELMKKNSKLSAAITGDYGANFLVQTAGTDAVKFSNGKIINNCSDPLLSTAWKFLNDLSSKYKVFSGVGYSSFFSGDIPMLFTGNYIAQRGDTLDKQAKFSWGYAPLPCPKGQKTVVSSMAKLWGFPVGAKNTEAASYWLRYWLDSSFDPADAPLWSDKSAGLLSFNDWLWEQNKQFNNYQGIVNYGGNYTWEQMCNALASGSDKVDSNLKAWSGTINSNINKLMKDFG